MSRSSGSLPHLTDERIQDWLDGRLSASEVARIEGHVDACPRCRAEVEGWQSLMGELSVLGELSPRSGFGGRVLDAVGGSAPERVSLAARVRSWLAAPPHPDPLRLQEFVDGTLGRRRARMVRRHLAACSDCRAEGQRWVALVDGLAALPRHAPSPGFAHAVMSQVRIAPAGATAHSLGRRLRDRARALAGPRQRMAWAAAAGVAFTPVVTVGLIAYAVFSHPLVTVGNLATFVWLEGSALAGTLGGGLLGGVLESASIFRAWSAVDALSPSTAGAGLLAVCALTLTSAWVVYRNVIASDRQVAHARR